MIKKFSLLFGGYLIIGFILFIINRADKYSPSMFGKWIMILTPIYLVAFFGISYLLKKKKNENP